MTSSTIPVLLIHALLVWFVSLEADANRGILVEDLARRDQAKRGSSTDELVLQEADLPANGTASALIALLVPPTDGSYSASVKLHDKTITTAKGKKLDEHTGEEKVKGTSERKEDGMADQHSEPKPMSWAEKAKRAMGVEAKKETKAPTNEMKSAEEGVKAEKETVAAENEVTSSKEDGAAKKIAGLMPRYRPRKPRVDEEVNNEGVEAEQESVAAKNDANSTKEGVEAEKESLTAKNEVKSTKEDGVAKQIAGLMPTYRPRKPRVDEEVKNEGVETEKETLAAKSEVKSTKEDGVAKQIAGHMPRYRPPKPRVDEEVKNEVSTHQPRERVPPPAGTSTSTAASPAAVSPEAPAAATTAAPKEADHHGAPKPMSWAEKVISRKDPAASGTETDLPRAKLPKDRSDERQKDWGKDKKKGITRSDDKRRRLSVSEKDPAASGTQKNLPRATLPKDRSDERQKGWGKEDKKKDITRSDESWRRLSVSEKEPVEEDKTKDMTKSQDKGRLTSMSEKESVGKVLDKSRRKAPRKEDSLEDPKKSPNKSPRRGDNLENAMAAKFAFSKEATEFVPKESVADDTDKPKLTWAQKLIGAQARIEDNEKETSPREKEPAKKDEAASETQSHLPRRRPPKRSYEKQDEKKDEAKNHDKEEETSASKQELLKDEKSEASAEDKEKETSISEKNLVKKDEVAPVISSFVPRRRPPKPRVDEEEKQGEKKSEARVEDKEKEPSISEKDGNKSEASAEDKERGTSTSEKDGVAAVISSFVPRRRLPKPRVDEEENQDEKKSEARAEDKLKEPSPSEKEPVMKDGNKSEASVEDKERETSISEKDDVAAVISSFVPRRRPPKPRVDEEEQQDKKKSEARAEHKETERSTSEKQPVMKDGKKTEASAEDKEQETSISEKDGKKTEASVEDKEQETSISEKDEEKSEARFGDKEKETSTEDKDGVAAVSSGVMPRRRPRKPRVDEDEKQAAAPEGENADVPEAGGEEKAPSETEAKKVKAITLNADSPAFIPGWANAPAWAVRGPVAHLLAPPSLAAPAAPVAVFAAAEEEVMERVLPVLQYEVTMAVQAVAHLETQWAPDELIRRIVKYIYNAAKRKALRSMYFEEACDDLVESAMGNYEVACGEQEWFFELDLAPAFTAAAWELLKGRPGLYFHQVQQKTRAAFEEYLDKVLLKDAMWEAASNTFKDAAVHSKIYSALQKAYQPAFEATIMEVGPDQDLRRVKTFLQHWMEDSMSRVWNAISNAQRVLTMNSVTRLFHNLITPFGPDDPYCTIPPMFTEHLGRPPRNWVFVNTAVQALFNTWRHKSSSRRKGGDAPYHLHHWG